MALFPLRPGQHIVRVRHDGETHSIRITIVAGEVVTFAYPADVEELAPLGPGINPARLVLAHLAGAAVFVAGRLIAARTAAGGVTTEILVIAVAIAAGIGTHLGLNRSK